MKYNFEYFCDTKQLKEYCDQLEHNLVCFKPYEPFHLLGFDGNVAKFENGERDLSCTNCKYLQKLDIPEKQTFKEE